MRNRLGRRSRLASFARVAVASVLFVVSSCGDGLSGATDDSGTIPGTLPVSPWLTVTGPGLPPPRLAATLGGPTPARCR